MRNLFDVALCSILISQFFKLRSYRLGLQQVCEEIDSLLDGQNRILLLRTDNRYIQKLVLFINSNFALE